MTKEEILFHTIGENLQDSIKSQLFGKPCFKINGKAFVCFFENEMVFKLTGDRHSEALSLIDAKLFDPSGKNRAMKEWVQVPVKHASKWREYARFAMDYVCGK